MKKSFAHYFARSVICLFLTVFLLLASACSSQPNKLTSGSSEAPSDLESENSDSVPSDETPSGSSDVPSDLESESSGAVPSDETPSGSSDVPSDLESENSGAVPSDEVPSGTSDFTDVPRMITRDTGKVYPLSEDDARYLSKLIGNKKTLPGGWKCICSYDFVLEDTTWSYCAEGGVFNNFAKNIGLDALNETEQARLDKIIMTSAGYAFTEGNEIRVTVCRTGESYSLSAEDARYLSELIGNAKPLPNIEVGTPDYEFISGKTAWSYCADEGFLTNPSEWIMIKKLSETERARLNGIVAASINAK